MRAAAIVALACAAVLAAGCGDDAGSGSQGAKADEAPRIVTRGPGPNVTIPAGRPPDRLIVEEIVGGDGAAARRGDELTVEYRAVRWNGSYFTNSWARRKPFRFELGAGSTIVNPGWEKGLVGIRVGGRRQLIVPPDFQYPGGAPPEASPADTLVYVVELIAIR